MLMKLMYVVMTAMNQDYRTETKCNLVVTYIPLQGVPLCYSCDNCQSPVVAAVVAALVAAVPDALVDLAAVAAVPVDVLPVRVLPIRVLPIRVLPLRTVSPCRCRVHRRHSPHFPAQTNALANRWAHERM